MFSTQEHVVVQNYINGKFVRTENNLESFNPCTGKVWAIIPDSSEEDVDLAVCAAKSAFKSWSNLPAETRSSFLLKLADLLEERIDEFAKAESYDQGKTFKQARELEIPRAIHNLRIFSTSILHKLERSNYMTKVDALNYTEHKPIGIAGLITPWNLPLYLLTFKLAPCIAAGNVCICKPSEMTSVTAWMFCQLCTNAGIPEGVINMVFGTGQSAGNAIVVHPEIKLISFTGSTKVGEIIQIKAAPFCKKLSLELGGKNAAIVFADCALENCVDTLVRASFLNQGEVCLCTSRIYVQEDIFQQFQEAFLNKVRMLKVGDPNSSDMGALISTLHLKRVKNFVNIAIQDGGTILYGNDNDCLTNLPEQYKDGYFMSPVVISGLNNKTCCMQEEIFGPVTCLSSFRLEDEAVDLANEVRYGLCASVFTENLSLAHRVSRKLEVGTVWVNCWLLRNLSMPFGGTKMSGIGKEGVEESFDFYTDAKTICIKLL